MDMPVTLAATASTTDAPDTAVISTGSPTDETVLSGDTAVIDPVPPRVLRVVADREQVLTEETVVLWIEADAPGVADAALQIRGAGMQTLVMTLADLIEQQFRVPVRISAAGSQTFEVQWTDLLEPSQATKDSGATEPQAAAALVTIQVIDTPTLSCSVEQTSTLDDQPQRLRSTRGGASDEAVRSVVVRGDGGEVEALIASDADAVAGVLRTSIEGSLFWSADSASVSSGYQTAAAVTASYEDRWVLQALDARRAGEAVQATVTLDVARSALGVAGSGLGGDDAAVTRVVVWCNGRETAFSARQRVLSDGSLSEATVAVDGDQLLTDKLRINLDAVLGSSVGVSVALTSWIEVRTGVADGLQRDLSLVQTEALLRWGGLTEVSDRLGAAVATTAWAASGLELPQPDPRTLLVGKPTDDQFGTATDGVANPDNPVLPATALADVLLGRNGADRLDGLAGADLMVGGMGDDLMIVDDVGDRVVEQDGQGNDTVWSTVDFVLPDGVENLVLLGTQTTASPAGSSDRVAANAASRATGNAASNWIAGNDGNNTLDGAGNADTLIGGPGDDTYYVDNPGDMVVEQPNEGEADVVMSAITTVLPTHVENLVMLPSAHHGSGNALNNALTGNAADNWLDGAAGDDIVMGLDGDDTLEGGDGADRLDGGAGNDTLTGGAGQDQLIGGAGNDAYWLGADDASDTIVELAEGGVDTVYSRVSLTLVEHIENLTLFGDANLAAIGNAGENWLVGNDGNNWMTSGAAEDLMAGGRGSDTYVYRRGDGKDRIQEQAEPDASASQVDQDLLILEAVYAPDTWVARQGDDLIVTVFGPAETTASAESVTPSTVAEVGQIKVLGWYAEQAQRLERIELADGVVLNSGQAERLVDALAMLVRPDQGSAGQSLDNLLAIDDAWIGVLYGI